MVIASRFPSTRLCANARGAASRPMRAVSPKGKTNLRLVFRVRIYRILLRGRLDDCGLDRRLLS
jgi:hypothetical protein